MKRWDHTREKRGGGKQGLTLLAVTVLLLSLLTTGVLAYFSARSNELTNTFTEKPEITYTLNMRLNYDVSDQTIWQTLTEKSQEDTYSFTLPNEAPTREGYMFLGWSGYREGEPPYQPGSKVRVDGSQPEKNVYAIWEEANTYTVTLNANGGTAGSVTQLTYTGGEDSHQFTLPSAAGEVPSIDYGTLAGWSTDPYTASHHTDEVLNTITLTKDSPSITLYAVWDAAVTLKFGYMVNWLLTDNYNVIFGSYAAYADEVNGLDWQAADQDDAGIYRVYRDDLNQINYILSMVGSTFHPTSGNLGSLLSDMGTADGNGFVRGLEYLNVSEALYLSSFFRSSNFVSLDLSCWDTSNVTGMAWMFGECEFLTELNLSGWDTSNCRSMVGLFNSCSSLTELDLSSWDTQAADDMTQMFEYCGELTTIYVGDKWNTDNLDPDTGRFCLFDGCYNLVGGAGTTYDGSDYYTDYIYAHVDGGPSNPGYFTYKAP